MAIRLSDPRRQKSNEPRLFTARVILLLVAFVAVILAMSKLQK